MKKAVKNEIPITFNNQTLKPGTLFTWEEDKKAYVHRSKETGKVLALMSEETADGYPDQFKRADYE